MKYRNVILCLSAVVVMFWPYYGIQADAAVSSAPIVPISIDLNPIQIAPTVNPYDNTVTKLRAYQAQQAVIEQQKIQDRMNTFYSNEYAWGNCTSWVASQRGVPSWWGNASEWAWSAKQAGWNVTSTPIVGAIAQTTVGWGGHVAYVKAIGDGTVTVSEMNVMGLDRVDINTYPTDYFTYLY